MCVFVTWAPDGRQSDVLPFLFYTLKLKGNRSQCILIFLIFSSNIQVRDTKKKTSKFNSVRENKQVIKNRIIRANTVTSVAVSHADLSESHATGIGIYIYGCSSVQFDWINEHKISL
jgi:hypothetical protein